MVCRSDRHSERNQNDDRCDRHRRSTTVLRSAVNRKVTHDTADDVFTGRRVGPKSKAETAPKGEQLPDEHVKHRKSRISKLSANVTVNNVILGLCDVHGHLFSHDHFSHSKILPCSALG